MEYKLAYPAECEITPKMIRDALCSLEWPKKRWTWRETYEDGVKERLLKIRDAFRGFTIDYIANPTRWFCIVLMWRSKRNRKTRELFALDSAAALHDFASWLAIHVIVRGSPLARITRHVVRLGVRPTAKQQAAAERSVARKTATESSVSALVSSAQVLVDRVDLDATHLLGALTSYRNEFVRFKSGRIVATVRRGTLAEARMILRDKPSVTACLGTFRDGYCLSIRWRNQSGTNGGLDLTTNEVVDDHQCTIVDFGCAQATQPAPVQSPPEPAHDFSDDAPDTIRDPECVPESGVRLVGEQKLVTYTPQFRERATEIAQTLGLQKPTVYTIGLSCVSKAWFAEFARTVGATRVVFLGDPAKYKSRLTAVDPQFVTATGDTALDAIHDAMSHGPVILAGEPLAPTKDGRHDVVKRVFGAHGRWHVIPQKDEILEPGELQNAITEDRAYECYALAEWLDERKQEATKAA